MGSIRLDGVWKSYVGEPARRGVSLEIGAGDAILLTGPSGAGKSTLLRLVFAADRADRGEIYVAGRNIARMSRGSIPFLRRNIGVVFQDFKLLPHWTALQNVAVALEILELPRADVRRRAVDCLAAVGLGHRMNTLAGRLSGGEQQRVAVARALVGEPAIVLCDEPTGNLDPDRARELLTLIEEIHLRGTTLIVATHDPAVVDFGVGRSWRRARLVDGELIDIDVALPIGRPVRLDEETEGFTERKDADATNIIRLRPRVQV